MPPRALLATACAVATLLASGAVALGSGQTPDRRLLITFSDAPTRAEVGTRLAGLGEVSPVLPETGIWALRPARPDEARLQALGRERVRGAEWPLARATAERKRVPPLPLPSGVASPSDPFYASQRQWGLLRSPWSPRVAARRVRPRIAVLDSGIDSSHEEWRSGSKGASPLADGRSTVRAAARWQDWGEVGHGTHVAGVAAAPANGVGIVGVAPAVDRTAEVIPVQISDRFGRSTDEDMIRGIRWAVNRGAKVINISAGGPGALTAFQETVYWATERGAVIVASVGNEGTAGPGFVNYPAGYRRVIGVGALCDGDPGTPDCDRDPRGVAAFSNRNRTVDLVAPGVNVLSTVPERVSFRRIAPGYALKDGTSMAAPFVAGAAALVFANHPRLSAFQVRRQLINTATDIGRRGRDNAAGYGIVNPQAAASYPAPPDDPFEVNDTLARAQPLSVAAGRRRTIVAAVDVFDDPTDLYRVRLRRGERLDARLAHRRGWVQLRLWRPGVRRVTRARRAPGLLSLGATRRSSGRARLSVSRRAPRTGFYYVDVAARRGVTSYTLVIERRSGRGALPGRGR
jgi:hypothetical protein